MAEAAEPPQTPDVGVDDGPKVGGLAIRRHRRQAHCPKTQHPAFIHLVVVQGGSVNR